MQLAATAGAATALTGYHPAPPVRLKKAVKFGMVDIEGTVRAKFELVKSLGFDGIELDSPSDLDIQEVVDASRATGLPIHGVVDSVHWKQTLSHPDPAVRAEGVAGLETALRDAQAFGASTVLLVPAVVNKEVSYADAYVRSQAEIRKVLPLAKEVGVKKTMGAYRPMLVQQFLTESVFISLLAMVLAGGLAVFAVAVAKLSEHLLPLPCHLTLKSCCLTNL